MTVYRKSFVACFTPLPPPNFRSNHLPKQKLAVFNTLIFRARHICSNLELFNSEINDIKASAVDRGLYIDIIDRILSKSPKVIGSVSANNEFKNIIFY